MNRKVFLTKTTLAGAGFFMVTSLSHPMENNFPALVNLHQLIPQPLIIRSIQMIETMDQLFVKVTAENGVTGVTMANTRLPNLVSIFQKIIVPYFKGKDARDNY